MLAWTASTILNFSAPNGNFPGIFQSGEGSLVVVWVSEISVSSASGEQAGTWPGAPLMPASPGQGPTWSPDEKQIGK